MVTYEQIEEIKNLLQVTNTCLVVIIFSFCVYALIKLYFFILKNILLWKEC